MRAAAQGRLPLVTDDVQQPLLVVGLVIAATAQLASTDVPYRGAAVALFVPAAVLARVSWLPWPRPTHRIKLVVLSVSAVRAGLLVPLAPSTAAPALAFVASSVAGENWPRRRRRTWSLQRAA